MDMATIRQIVRAGEGSAGSGGSWRVYGTGDDPRELWHHGTLMLRWNPRNPCDASVLAYSTGWGSVSDQGGMNAAFQVLELPLRYDRAGGADIRILERPQRSGFVL